MATAEALTDAAFSGCGITVHHSAEHNDPLFQNFSPGYAALDGETQLRGGAQRAGRQRLQPEFT
ncbi:hypothetical protein ACZ87_00665 [Candidatus Erwinia dacicola]|uniref:Uncharacterized protein n=1 Tax=Candidatus Erwinia dacicola TaxID=252393 RepID=A0A328TUM7_9GAMM|nr:hypothetical protein [Candidatus Erwinia dacicola]RAP72505.1 hypothetical protein ACZ87_00665 [Candidatus Erwinia dacicola]